MKQVGRVLDGVPGIAFIHFGAEDVVRHPLVQRIVSAYAREEDARSEPQGNESRRGMTRRARAVVVTVQNASRGAAVPRRPKLRSWARAALADEVRGELTVRIVDESGERGVELALPRQEGGHERAVVSGRGAEPPPAAARNCYRSATS